MVTRKKALQLGGAAVLTATAAPLVADAVAQAAGTTTISFMNWWSAARKPMVDAIIKRFEARYPNVTVINNLRPYDRLEEQTLTALLSSDPPGVLMAQRTDIPNFAAQGTIEPLGPVMQALGITADKFYPSYLQTGVWKGQLYSLPITTGAEYSSVLYNVDLFRKAGLNPARPPRTWQEYMAAAAAMTKRDARGKVVQMGADVLYSGYSYQFISYLYCNNGTLYSPDKKKIAFNSPEGVGALQFMLDLVNKLYGGIVNYNDFVAGEDDFSARFPWFQGKMGMFPVGFWQFAVTTRLAPTLHYGVTSRPYNGANPAAKSQSPLSSGWGYVVPAGLSPEKKQAAHELLKFLTSDLQGGCQLALGQGVPAALPACNALPAFQTINPHFNQVLTLIPKEVAIPLLPPHQKIMNQIDRYVEQAFYGKVTAKKALDMAAQAGQQLLDQFWNSVH